MMTRQTKGALWLAVLLFVLTGCAWLLMQYLSHRHDLETSDSVSVSQKATVRVDNWGGYFVVCSREMLERMQQSGTMWECVDDKAVYSERMEALDRGDADFAVFTVDSDILNGIQEENKTERRYPGTMIMVIDESLGGDSFWARSERVKNIDDLKKLKDPKICFTPNSPSEHFLKVLISSFDITSTPWRNDAWKVKADTNSSVEAFDNLVAGKCDAAVIWEPETTKAKKTQGLLELISTKNMNRTIVDVLVVNRDYLRKHPEVTDTVLSNYFRALKYYKDNESVLLEEMSDKTGIPKEEVGSVLEGFKWVNLQDNANQWFGISRPGEPSTRWLIESIRSAVDVLDDVGDKRELPGNDPYRLIFSKPIENLYLNGISGKVTSVGNSSTISSLEAKFSPMTDEQWKNQRRIGTLKIRPITFLNGVSLLDSEGKEQVDKIMEAVSRSPDYRILVTGHTSAPAAYLSGEALAVKQEANIALSEERANVVRQYCLVTYNLDPNRIKAIGAGSKDLLERLPGESDRAFNERQRRVEVLFVVDEF